MKTFYIIMSRNGEIVASGSGVRYTSSLNYAKHFTSVWSAENFQKRNGLNAPVGYFFIKKICHQ